MGRVCGAAGLREECVLVPPQGQPRSEQKRRWRVAPPISLIQPVESFARFPLPYDILELLRCYGPARRGSLPTMLCHLMSVHCPRQPLEPSPQRICPGSSPLPPNRPLACEESPSAIGLHP